MLEQAGFQAELQVLDPVAYQRQTLLSYLEQPPEQYAWDIALRASQDTSNFPVFSRYHMFALEVGTIGSSSSQHSASSMSRSCAPWMGSASRG